MATLDREGVAPPHPGVRFPPPTLLVASFVVGWLLETRVRRLPLVADLPSTAGNRLEWIGIGLALLGFAFAAWGLVTFWRARTAIFPNQPAARIVSAGPYRYSRNPMYVGLAVAYIGFAVRLNLGWPLVLLPIALAALYGLVIRREERYLSSAFGEDYATYRARVRRWL